MADPTVSRIGSLIRQLQGALGENAIRSGQHTFAYTGGTGVAAVTINHGLGRTPVEVFAATKFVGGIVFWGAVGEGSVNATSFSLGTASSAAYTGNVTIGWVAIG